MWNLFPTFTQSGTPNVPDCFLHMNTRRNTFSKAERLCGLTTVAELVATGSSFRVFPFRVVWRETEVQEMPVRVVFAVPKRSFKRAVMRNRIRRQMREAYRINKHELYDKLNSTGRKLQVMIVYTHREALATADIQDKIILTLRRLSEQLSDAGTR